MVNSRKQLATDRLNAVLTEFQQHGSLSYSELAKSMDITYNKARDYVTQLVTTGQLRPLKTVGRTIYFGTSGDSSMPSIMGTQGLINFNVVVRRMLQGPIIQYDLNALVNEMFSTIYSQPTIAKASSSVDPNDIARIDDLATDLERIASFLNLMVSEVRGKLLPSNPSVDYARWYEDTLYDKELAVQVRQKFTEGSMPLIEAYKLLVGEAGGITPVPVDPEVTDQS